MNEPAEAVRRWLIVVEMRKARADIDDKRSNRGKLEEENNN
jgi:hypothetical protein